MLLHLKKYATCTAKIFRFTVLVQNRIILTDNSVNADLQCVPKMLGPTSRTIYTCYKIRLE